MATQYSDQKSSVMRRNQSVDAGDNERDGVQDSTQGISLPQIVGSPQNVTEGNNMYSQHMQPSK